MNTIQRKLPTVARILLGLVFFVFGLNGFLHFLPMPPMTGVPAEFFGAMVASRYLIPLLKGTEVLAGILLLSGRFVPLALTVLAPILVNIVCFHAFVEQQGVGLPLVFTALEIYLAWAYRSSFAPMLRAAAKPDVAEETPTAEGRPATARS